MESNVTALKFQLELPSSTDKFDGNGHENAARAIGNIIEHNPDVHIVGIEGALGAGKSTIIKILESMLNQSKYHFMCFDVDKYSHISTKSALIKIMSSELINIANHEDKEKILEAKGRALGNLLEYTKTTTSKISPYVILFIFSFALTFKYIKDFFVAAFSTVNALISQSYDPNLELTLKSCLAISPIFVFLTMKLHKFISKKAIPTVGDLLKRNSEDSIREEIKINKDVGSFELKEAIETFVNVIPDGKVIILIIDNIDRLQHDKAKEIWSDIEIFTSACNDKMRILLPFSELHFSLALNEKNPEVGKEFISKRLPVIFRAPPIVTYGWRSQFKNYWEETLSNLGGSNECADLIQVWLYSRGQVTPRMLKKCINEIACIFLCFPNSNFHTKCCLAYVLAVRYHSISLENFLSKDLQVDSTLTENDVKKIQATHEILGRSLGDDEWTTEVACIHYQTDANIAKSELLLKPIIDNLNNSNYERIFELSKIYGFDLFFQGVLRKGYCYKAYKVMAPLLSCDDERILFAHEWIVFLNGIVSRNSFIESHDFEYIESLLEILEKGIQVDTGHIDRTVQHLIDNFDASTKKQDDIKILYGYCRINDSIPDFVSSPDHKIYIDCLWKNKEAFDLWDIDSIIFESEELSAAIHYAINEQTYSDSDLNLFLKDMSGMYKVGYAVDAKKFKDLPTQQLNIGNEFLYLFSPSWYEPKDISRIAEMISNQKISKENKVTLVSILFAKLINCNALNIDVTINNKVVPISEFILPLLADGLLDKTIFRKFLVGVHGAASIFNCFDDEKYGDYIKDSLYDLIVSGDINRLNVDYFIKNYYEHVRELFVDKIDRLLRFVSGWRSAIDEPYELWPESFFNDVLTSKNSSSNSIVLHSFDSLISSDAWLERIDKCHKRTMDIVSVIYENERKIKNFSNACEAVIQYLKGASSKIENFSDKKNFVFKLINIFPEAARGKIDRAAGMIFSDQSTSMLHRFNLIELLRDRVCLPEPASKSLKDIYTSMIDSANDKVVADWLNNQNYFFENWKMEDLIIFREAIESSSISHLFNPLLIKMEPFM